MNKSAHRSTPLRPMRRVRQRGVMLLEVLVSVLIFSFGILGVVAMHARGTQLSTNAEDRNRAALLANEMATAMLLRGSNDVSNAALSTYYSAWQTRVGDAAGTGLPGGTGTVSAVAANTVTITVQWTPTFGGGNQRFVTQVTM